MAKHPFENYSNRNLGGHKKKVYSVGWNCSGELLATGSLDKTIRIWSSGADGPQQRQVFEGHSDSVDILQWSSTEPDILASTSTDKTLRFWDVRSARCTAKMKTGAAGCLCLTWHPAGHEVAYCANDDSITVVDTRMHKQQHRKPPRAGELSISEICYAAGGKVMLLTTGSGSVDILQYPSLTHVRSLQAHCAACYCVAVDATSRYMATGGGDALATLWDMESLVCMHTFAREDYSVRTLGFSCDSRYLAFTHEFDMGSKQQRFNIVDVENGSLVHSFSCRHSSDSFAWNPKHLIMAYAGDEVVEYDKSGRTLPPLAMVTIFAPAVRR